MRFGIIIKQIICIVILTLIFNIVFITPVNALDDVVKSAQDFALAGVSIDSALNTTKLKTTSSFIFNICLVIAIIIAVGVGVILGIKFITESVEGQAKIKEALVPYIVGCIVIFAAFPIWKFAVDSGMEATKDRRISYNQNGDRIMSVNCPWCSNPLSVNLDHGQTMQYSHNCGCKFYLYTDASIKLVKIPYKYCYMCGREIASQHLNGQTNLCSFCINQIGYAFDYCSVCKAQIVNGQQNDLANKLCPNCAVKALNLNKRIYN